jgi:hypothetical protein
LFDSRFEVGGYEDDDLSVRAVQKGYLPGIVLDTFVGHQVSRTLNTLFAEQAGGVANYINYALKWEHLTQKKQDVVAAYRVSIKCINDIAQLRSSLMKFATVGDGIALLLTNHPKEALSSYDAVLRGKLNQVDLEFFDACAELPNDISECQSELQKGIYDKNLSSEKITYNLSGNLWNESSLKVIKETVGKPKNGKVAVVKSILPQKGTPEATGRTPPCRVQGCSRATRICRSGRPAAPAPPSGSGYPVPVSTGDRAGGASSTPAHGGPAHQRCKSAGCDHGGGHRCCA